ncbi:PLD nuclease N-terminal domain-containing protein [uncultured Jatrophihabitans sp.]|uniref:PLD nuclease N-terminal domain-containing protein n=1 Tax=uncultured Jatrophihabitans sp. TaxID=1610747 RepID=UPI0035CA47CE
MLFFDGILGVVAFGVWVFCIIDVVITRRDQVRTLPKLAWLLIVVVFAAIGGIAWLVFGRPWTQQRVLVGAGRTQARPGSPDDDEEFLATLDARMREQRRAREQERDDPEA